MARNGLISGAIRGGREAQAELALMERRVDVASAVAIRKVTQMTKARIKGGMRGRPRWDRRGASSRTGPVVDLDLTPHHVTRNGGPGKLSGALIKSIRSSRRPRRVVGGFSAVVLSGGAGGPQNLYKRRIEARAPYFASGVKRATPKLPAIWDAAWAKATKTKK